MSSPNVSDFVRAWSTARERAASPAPGKAEQAKSLLDLIEAQLNRTDTTIVVLDTITNQEGTK